MPWKSYTFDTHLEELGKTIDSLATLAHFAADDIAGGTAGGPLAGGS